MYSAEKLRPIEKPQKTLKTCGKHPFGAYPQKSVSINTQNRKED